MSSPAGNQALEKVLQTIDADPTSSNNIKNSSWKVIKTLYGPEIPDIDKPTTEKETLARKIATAICKQTQYTAFNARNINDLMTSIHSYLQDIDNNFFAAVLRMVSDVSTKDISSNPKISPNVNDQINYIYIFIKWVLDRETDEEKQYKQQKQNLETEKKNLENKVQALEADNKEKDKNLRDLDNDLQNANANANAMQNRATALENINKDKDDKLGDLDQQLKTCQENLANLNDDLTNEKEKLKICQDENQKKDEALAKCEEEKAKTNALLQQQSDKLATLPDLEAENDTLKQQVPALQEQLEKAQKIIDDLNQRIPELEEAANKCNDMSTELEALRKEKADNAGNPEKIADLEQKVLDLEREIEGLKSQINSLGDENQELQEKLNNCQQSNQPTQQPSEENPLQPQQEITPPIPKGASNPYQPPGSPTTTPTRPTITTPTTTTPTRPTITTPTTTTPTRPPTTTTTPTPPGQEPQQGITPPIPTGTPSPYQPSGSPTTTRPPTTPTTTTQPGEKQGITPPVPKGAPNPYQPPQSGLSKGQPYPLTPSQPKQPHAIHEKVNPSFNLSPISKDQKSTAHPTVELQLEPINNKAGDLVPYKIAMSYIQTVPGGADDFKNVIEKSKKEIIKETNHSPLADILVKSEHVLDPKDETQQYIRHNWSGYAADFSKHPEVVGNGAPFKVEIYQDKNKPGWEINSNDKDTPELKTPNPIDFKSANPLLVTVLAFWKSKTGHTKGISHQVFTVNHNRVPESTLNSSKCQCPEPAASTALSQKTPTTGINPAPKTVVTTATPKTPETQNPTKTVLDFTNETQIYLDPTEAAITWKKDDRKNDFAEVKMNVKGRTGDSGYLERIHVELSRSAIFETTSISAQLSHTKETNRVLNKELIFSAGRPLIKVNDVIITRIYPSHDNPKSDFQEAPLPHPPNTLVLDLTPGTKTPFPGVHDSPMKLSTWNISQDITLTNYPDHHSGEKKLIHKSQRTHHYKDFTVNEQAALSIRPKHLITFKKHETSHKSNEQSHINSLLTDTIGSYVNDVEAFGELDEDIPWEDQL